MGTFVAPSVKQAGPCGNFKIAVISTVGSGSYATGGDTLDLSSAAAGLGDKFNGFTEVFSVNQCSYGAAADSKYFAAYIPAALGAAATGLVKIHDLTAASDAELASTTSLSAVTFYFTVIGR